MPVIPNYTLDYQLGKELKFFVSLKTTSTVDFINEITMKIK